MTLFALENLSVEIGTPDGVIHPVTDVSWSVEQGETTALVGESGSGKSVSALAAMGLLSTPPARITAGHIRFKGEDLLALPPEKLRHVRGADIAMVFQEPMTSLNPVRSIGHQLTEHTRLHLGLSKAAARERAMSLLLRVGIAEPEQRLSQFPHHLSGGMRQRVMIAIALACEPQLIIADEPTTALDVTIQGQILETPQRTHGNRGGRSGTYHPQPWHRRPLCPSRKRDVWRSHRRASESRGTLSQPTPPLHHCFARFSPPVRSSQGRVTQSHTRLATGPRGQHARLPIPTAMPICR